MRSNGGKESNQETLMSQAHIKKVYFQYEPSLESEVIILFGFLMPYIDKNWTLVEFRNGFPDCIFEVDGKEKRGEFELRSSNFKTHEHDINGCDIIICWKDNWPNCPLKVFDLSRFIREKNLINILKNKKSKKTKPVK